MEKLFSCSDNVDVIRDNRDGSIMVLKRPKVQNEVDVSTLLFHHPHPNIAQILDIPTATEIKIKYYTRGDLFEWIETQPNLPLPISTVKRLFNTIVAGVAHCHTYGIAHRDLSLENILLDKNFNCVLCDFDLSSFNGRMCSGIVGKMFYVAPESFTTDTYDGICADIWSLGIILFILLTGMPPFEVAKETDVRFQRHQRYGLLEGLLKPWKIYLPSSAVDLLQKMLQGNPANRIALGEVVGHPFLQHKKQLVTSRRFLFQPAYCNFCSQTIRLGHRLYACLHCDETMCSKCSQTHEH